MDCAVIYSEAALADLEHITAFIAADNAEVAARRYSVFGMEREIRLA